MPRTESEELERQHFWIYKDDVAWLDATFGRGSGTKAGKSLAVRKMIRKFRQAIEANAAVSAKRPGGLNDPELNRAIDELSTKPSEPSQPG